MFALLLVGCAEGELFGEEGASLDGLIFVLVTPEQAIVPVGGELQLVATGMYEDRSTQDLTALVTWSSSSESVLEVSDELDNEGIATGQEEGVSVVTAEAGSILSPEVDVRVTEAGIVGLSIEPSAVSIASGDSVHLTAMASFEGGERGDATGQVRWIVDDGDVATLDADGTLHANSTGSTEVKAAWDDVESDPVPVDVEGGGSGKANLLLSGSSGYADDGVVTVTLEVTNDGDVGAADFWVDAFLDPSGEPSIGETGDAFAYVYYLGPGETETVTLSFYGDGGDVWVLLDSADAIDESDEDDNVYSGAIGSGGGGGADLAITYFDWYSYDGDTYYAIDVTNVGTEDVSDMFYVDVWIDRSSEPGPYEDGDGYAELDGLAAGETEWLEFVLDGECYDCAAWAYVDGYDFVGEADEDNNVAGPIYTY